MARGWPFLFPVFGIGWWLLGFPPGWGWLVTPMFPDMPVTVGMLVVLATLVVGLALFVRFTLDNA
jgi:hypothetical protein